MTRGDRSRAALGLLLLWSAMGTASEARADDGGPGSVDVPDATAPSSVREGGASAPAENDELLVDLPPPPPPDLPTEELRVGVAGSPPFVVDRDGALTGVSVEMFRAVAERARIHYRLVSLPSADATIAALARGAIDVAVGPLSVTARRAQHVEFTQPHFHADLAIASSPAGSIWQRIRPFFSAAFFTGIALLLLVLFGVGTLTWLVERKRNTEHFPERPLEGIGNGVWFALVTMTTVGYGDRAPGTVAGRVVAGVWMVLSMVIASSLIASIASALTLAQLDRSTIARAADLDGRSVGVVRGTTAVAFVREVGGRVVPMASMAEALEAAAEGRVDAVVGDRPVLRYELGKRPELSLEVADSSYRPQDYAFAVPLGSDLARRINVALLELENGRRFEIILAEWLGGG